MHHCFLRELIAKDRKIVSKIVTRQVTWFKKLDSAKCVAAVSIYLGMGFMYSSDGMKVQWVLVELSLERLSVFAI